MNEEQIRKQVLQILVDYHNEDIGNDAADKIIAIMQEEQEKRNKEREEQLYEQEYRFLRDQTGEILLKEFKKKIIDSERQKLRIELIRQGWKPPSLANDIKEYTEDYRLKQEKEECQKLKAEQNKFDKIYASRKAEFESGIRVERERIMTELPEKLDKVVDEEINDYYELSKDTNKVFIADVIADLGKLKQKLREVIK